VAKTLVLALCCASLLYAKEQGRNRTVSYPPSRMVSYLCKVGQIHSCPVASPCVDFMQAEVTLATTDETFQRVIYRGEFHGRDERWKNLKKAVDACIEDEKKSGVP
jgi:hypothetical protein